MQRTYKRDPVRNPKNAGVSFHSRLSAEKRRCPVCNRGGGLITKRENSQEFIGCRYCGHDTRSMNNSSEYESGIDKENLDGNPG